MKTNGNNIEFIDNSNLNGGNDRYLNITVRTDAVLKSWKKSLFSFEWLTPDGDIKTIAQLSENEKPKREAVEKKLANNQPIERPILGIGVMDNVEIGIGRAEFLTLATHGVERIAVHILKSNESDFKAFRADIS